MCAVQHAIRWVARIRICAMSRWISLHVEMVRPNFSAMSPIDGSSKTTSPTLSSHSVAVAGAVILRTDHQTATLLCALVDSLQDVDNLLLVLQHPIQLIVVTRPEVAHHVLVPKEEHDGARVVEFVHLLEVGHLVEIADVDDGKVPDAIRDFVEHFILAHAVRVRIAPESDHDQAVFFRHDCLVHVPCGWEMRNDDGTHRGGRLQRME